MILARVPLKLFARYRSVHVQNLAQSNISAATFGAANSLLVPMTISQRADAAKAVGSRSDEELRGALQIGAVGYVAIAALIAAIGGLASELSWPMLIAFVIYTPRYCR
jgi:hypothetical protein